MDDDTISLVQRSWAKAALNKHEFSRLLYEKLFDLDPTLVRLFRVNLTPQQEQFMSTMDVAVAGLSRVEELAPMLRKLGERHTKYGAKDKDYETVGQAIVALTRAFMKGESLRAGAVCIKAV